MLGKSGVEKCWGRGVQRGVGEEGFREVLGKTGVEECWGRGVEKCWGRLV